MNKKLPQVKIIDNLTSNVGIYVELIECTIYHYGSINSLLRSPHVYRFIYTYFPATSPCLHLLLIRENDNETYSLTTLMSTKTKGTARFLRQREKTERARQQRPLRQARLALLSGIGWPTERCTSRLVVDTTNKLESVSRSSLVGRRGRICLSVIPSGRT